MFLRMAMIALALLVQPMVVRAEKSVAITFDDLPFVGDGLAANDVRRIKAANDHILAALRKAKTPATGFAVQARGDAIGTPANDRILALWTRGAFDLANHSYSHPDFNTLDLTGAKAEIDRGAAAPARLMAAAGKTLRYFRFPMNHTGDTREKHDAIRAHLAEKGYVAAASTIDTSDWMFDAAYAAINKRGDKAAAARLRKAYLDHSAVQIDYYAGLSRQVLGYEPPQIMLLHVNSLNAELIGPLLDLFRQKGYRFVSLDEAMRDPAYQAPPGFITKFGPMWGYRWARERSVKVDGSLEQEPPAWVAAEAEGKPGS